MAPQRGHPERTNPGAGDPGFDRSVPDAVTTAVVEAVAQAKGVSPTDLEPLYTAVDPDALDGLLASQTATPLTVEFSYAGRRVRVANDGTVTVS